MPLRRLGGQSNCHAFHGDFPQLEAVQPVGHLWRHVFRMDAAWVRPLPAAVLIICER